MRVIHNWLGGHDAKQYDMGLPYAPGHSSFVLGPVGLEAHDIEDVGIYVSKAKAKAEVSLQEG